MKQKRLALSPETVRRCSQRVFERLMASVLYQEARCLACYVSVKKEIDTRHLIQTALQDHKRVGVPVTDGTPQMVFQAISSLDMLRPVQLGLLEPLADPDAVIPPENLDLILVPGLAFDRLGNRLGYGGGYYDRFLSFTRAPSVALAYDFQILNHIPTAPHDVRLNVLVTETETIVCPDVSNE